MNSEELELSLRAEFESYLKGVLAGIKQDVSEFQKNFEAEFEKHKTQLDEAIRNLSTRFESEPAFDSAFTESVMEHLRLARDEGATITAQAIGAAEKLKSDDGTAANYDLIRDAIKDITAQTSQSAILKSLVEHAGNFAPRGAFFIVKNDHFVGWKTFGKEGEVDEKAVQEVHFPAAIDTLLSAAAGSLQLTESPFGGHTEDGVFLEPLGFGRPDRMYAIPLIARGRGVAVMYADYGTTGVSLNADALETIVRVAGLTVELLAASNEAKSQQETFSAQPVNVSDAQPASFEESVEPSSFSYQPAEEATFETNSQVEIAEPPAPEQIEEYTGAVALEPETA
ncbi:MAG TPA: hypothetical protein VK468_09220, partial [Pyrinomonadaceae bacterium]|nr:hypothetical protein [Pyrinomonadaceae bacterium]